MGLLSPRLPRPFRIRERTCECSAGDVFSWVLDPVDGPPLNYRPGQFNMLYHFGTGEVPISVSGDAASEGLVHTLRAVGGVTRVLQGLAAGESIGVRGPFGSAWPLEEAAGRDLVLVAGGLGLAPLRPVMYHAIRHRERYRRVFLIYGTREPPAILYRQELQAWRARFDLEVEVTVDRGCPGWGGAVGVVTKLIERGGFDPAEAIALLCGPEVMMRFSVLTLQRMGVAAERIYVSLERNMKCAIGHCGHCQFLSYFICKDGPVFRFDAVAPWLDVREL